MTDQSIFNSITIITFAMTSISWIVNALIRSIHLQFDVLDYRTDYKTCSLYVRFVNKSHLPIVIYAISIIDNGYEHFCYLQPTLIRTNDTLEFHSAQFPVNLSPLEGRQEYLHYRNFPENKPIELIEGKNLAFRICTNRKTIKRHVTLGKISYYLHIQN